MLEARVPLKAAQERLGHSRPDILLKFYAHVLDGSADAAEVELRLRIARLGLRQQLCIGAWLCLVVHMVLGGCFAAS